MSKTVRINVGGKVFETFQSTVDRLQYFQTLFNSQFFRPEEEIFIDRDPKVFRLLLNHLRDKNNVFPKKYWQDLEYYGIEVKEKTEPEEKIKHSKMRNLPKDKVGSGFLMPFVAINDQTSLVVKNFKNDQFFRKKYQIKEVMLEPSIVFWKDELNLYLSSGHQDLGQNFLLYFDVNQDANKYMKSHKDYFDLISQVDIYLLDRTDTSENSRQTFLNNAKNNIFSAKYESCNSEELYVKFLHSQKLKKNKSFDHVNIIPILIADEKISKKFSEHQPTLHFEQYFAVHITFKKNYLSVIDDLKVRSYGYIADRKALLKTTSLTLYRWVKYNKQQYRIGPGQKIRFDSPFEEANGLPIKPIKTLFLRLKIDKIKNTVSAQKAIKYIELYFYHRSSYMLDGQSFIYHYIREKDGCFIFWYKFEFEFYLYPQRINESRVKVTLSESLDFDGTITITSYFHEVLNYWLGCTEPKNSVFSDYKTISVYHSPNFSTVFKNLNQ